MQTLLLTLLRCNPAPSGRARLGNVVSADGSRTLSSPIVMRPLTAPTSGFALLVLLTAAGCGTLVPYSLAPSWLAPDVTPPRDAPAIVLLDQREIAGPSVLRGRVVDLTTGRPVVGAVVTVNGFSSREEPGTPDDTFALVGDAEGEVRLHAEAPGYAPTDGTVPVALGTESSVLVLMRRLPEEAATAGA